MARISFSNSVTTQLLESLVANNSLITLNLEWSANLNSEEACMVLAKLVALNLQLTMLDIDY